MTFNKAMWSSSHGCHPSPKNVYEGLDDVYHFDLDAATSEDNPMGAPKYYTEVDDGLVQPWLPSTYCNPPFSRVRKENGVDVRENMLMKWVLKAQRESTKGNIIVMLLGSRTGTKWTQNVCFKSAKMVCFVRGRLKFGEAKNSAPFDSVLFHFSMRKVADEEFQAFSKFGATFYIDSKKLTVNQSKITV